MSVADPDWDTARGDWAELTPLVRRIVRADVDALARMRGADRRVTAFGRLPTKALVARTVALPNVPHRDEAGGRTFDVTMGAADLLAWLDGESELRPARADAGWLAPLPPVAGWLRVDQVPDAVVREVVRQGAMAHADAASLALGARAAENLLDTPVLTVAGGGFSVELTNRTLSAVTSMGFLPRGGHVVVAVARGWTRVAAPNGSVFAARGGGGLGLL